MPRSVEGQTILAVLVAALIVGLGGIVFAGKVAAPPARSGDAVADSIASAIAGGAHPQTLLGAYAAAGAIRSATLYDAAGSVVARSGAASASSALVCRSLASGGSLCIEPVAATQTLPRSTLIAFGIAALVAGIIVALLASIGVRSRLRSMRNAIEEAMTDPAYARRVPAQAGALGPLAGSVNQLLDQVQTRDVTLRRRSTELENANKDLEAFAYAVSHDLRAPLGSITGFAQALQEDHAPKLDEFGRECVFWILESGKQMGQLIEGLLQMARFSSAEIKRSEVDLTEIARGIATSLQHRDPHRSVVFSIPENLRANGDERLLRAVLENLMGNAWKFTSKRPDARIEVGVRQEDGLPAFYVRDNGAGFDPAHAAKMFRPFQRLHSDSEFSGTGIGLATVHKIVQRHGGRAWAEGEPQRGATIYFTTGASREAYV